MRDVGRKDWISFFTQTKWLPETVSDFAPEVFFPPLKEAVFGNVSKNILSSYDRSLSAQF